MPTRFERPGQSSSDLTPKQIEHPPIFVPGPLRRPVQVYTPEVETRIAVARASLGTHLPYPEGRVCSGCMYKWPCCIHEAAVRTLLTYGGMKASEVTEVGGRLCLKTR